MTATAALNQACDDLSALLAAAHRRLDARHTPPAPNRYEEATAGTCYERQAA